MKTTWLLTVRRTGACLGRCLLSVLACLALAAGGAVAQDDGSGGLPSLSDSTKNLTLLSVPSATVAPHGMGFASLGLTSKRGGTANNWDGSLALGLGLGDASESVGVQITANITSLRGNFGDSGYFGIRLSRQLTNGRAPLFLGAEVNGLGTWGQARNVPESGNVMLTWFPVLETSGGSYPLMFTAGYGSHRKNRLTDPAPFFGAGIGLTRNFGASMSWTGETLDVGASFTIDGVDFMNITAEVNDVTDRLGSRRFTINFNFFRPGLFRS